MLLRVICEAVHQRKPNDDKINVISHCSGRG